jgi:hypothetical protein
MAVVPDPVPTARKIEREGESDRWGGVEGRIRVRG